MTGAGDVPDLTIEPLARRHDRGAFTCARHPSLAHYLKALAGQDARRRLAATFVLVEGGSSAALGYYTLSACSLEVDGLPADLVRKARLPSDRIIPATLLGRLAVADEHAGRGYGEFLLMDALHRSLLHAADIASYAVVVDAIDDKAAGFYRRYDFIPFTRIANRLFLPMGTIAGLFLR